MPSHGPPQLYLFLSLPDRARQWVWWRVRRVSVQVPGMLAVARLAAADPGAAPVDCSAGHTATHHLTRGPANCWVKTLSCPGCVECGGAGAGAQSDGALGAAPVPGDAAPGPRPPAGLHLPPAGPQDRGRHQPLDSAPPRTALVNQCSTKYVLVGITPSLALDILGPSPL